MHHIVVASDLTPASDPAIERAAIASCAMGAELRLLHVLPELLPPVLGSRRLQRTERMLLYRARGLERSLGARVSYGVMRGETARGIVRESENFGAVLTVFGRSTADLGSRRFVDTIPERSLRLIRNAALVVRDRSSGRAGYRRALLAPEPGIELQSLTCYLQHIAPQAALHRVELVDRATGRSAKRKAVDQVRAMRRALDADLLIIGIPRDETMNPFRFRSLLAPLVRAPECDTLVVPQDCDVAPDAVPEPGRVRIAS